MPLTPEYESKLDSIKVVMVNNEEPEDVISFVENKFRQRYGNYVDRTGHTADTVDTPRTLFGMSPQLEKNIFTTGAGKRNIGAIPEQALSALSTPVRALGTLRTNPKTGKKFRMDNPQSFLFKPEAARMQRKMPGEGFPSKVTRGAIGFGAEIASDPTLPFAVMGKGVSRIASKMIRKPRQLATKASSYLTGISKPAIEKATTKAGRAVIKKHSQKQLEIGESLLKKLDNLGKFLPEKQVISKAVKNIPKINTDKVIDVLKGSKVNKPIDETLQNFNKRVDDIINRIQEVKKIPPSKILNAKGLPAIPGKVLSKKMLSAERIIDIRRQLDDIIGDAFGKESGNLLTSAKEARHVLAEMLVDAAKESGNKEYVDAMSSLASKMKKVDNLKGYIGKSKDTREKNVENFIRNLFGKGKVRAQKSLREIDEMFGTSTFTQAEIARMAEEFGEKGTPSIMASRMAPGSMFVKAATIPFSSPKMATSLSLPAIKAAERAVIGMGRGGKYIGKHSMVKGVPGIAGATGKLLKKER